MQREHRGTYGDFQWHTTAVSDYDDFYADAATVRDVTTFETYFDITVGEPVCFYGRASNSRDCSLDVEVVGQHCVNDGVPNDHLVRMNGVGVATSGDSGGPWFVGTKAYGITKGICAPDWYDRAVFSSVYWLPEALGVEIVCGSAC